MEPKARGRPAAPELFEHSFGPRQEHDPHFNSQGERVYLESVKFIPVHRIRGWRPDTAGEHEHVSLGPSCRRRELPVGRVRNPSGGTRRKIQVRRRESPCEFGYHFGRETLIPVIFEDDRGRTPAWLAPGIRPKYASADAILFSEFGRDTLTLVRSGEWMRKPFGDLLQSMQGAPMLNAATFSPVADPCLPRAVFPKNQKGHLVLVFEFIREDILESETHSSFSYFTLKKPAFNARSWLELFASGKVERKNPARLAKETIAQITHRTGRCDELRLTLRPKN